METRQKVVVAVVALLIAGVASYVFYFRGIIRTKQVQEIKQQQMQQQEQAAQLNQGPVSPISGLPCDNWNRRPLAVMQAADVAARPSAGFSQADMVIEMPAITASITRLMGVYVCNTPDQVGSIRSARVDFISIAEGLDAIFAHWGRATWGAIDVLNDEANNIDNLNCNNDAGKSAGQCCFRNSDLVGMHSGYARPAELLKCAQDFGYRMEDKFSGYPHQAEAIEANRPAGGDLRVAFAGPYAAEYTYDKATNTYLRTWGNVPDTDRNNGERIAPKNVVVLIASSSQTEGQYNNMQLGDPWYDDVDNGQAYYYMNGQEYRGTWKKDKSSATSKLTFYDESGQEVKFVPGQIWVDILEPGQALKWTPTN